MQVQSTVAIIGGGPGGLVAAKEAKACGLAPTIFEKNKTIGGQWSAEGAVWDSMRLNNSRYSSSFSDFEWKEGSSDFPNRLDVYNYLLAYATKFDIHHHVKLNCEVKEIKKKRDDRWCVKWMNESISYKNTYNFVIVCSGLFSIPYKPTILGIKTFTGTVMHSSQYKNPDSFAGKKVAIIGNSYSASEIATNVATTAQETIHIFRKAVWICTRYNKAPNSDEDIPCDLLFSRSQVYSSTSLNIPERNQSQNKYFAENFKKQSEVSSLLTVEGQPSDPPFITISDDYLPLVEAGKITLKKGTVKYIDNELLHLCDDTALKVDVLIFCTGYRLGLPFCDTKLQEDLGFDKDDPLQPLILYKATIPPKHPNLAFLGLMRLGNYHGVLELQARFATLLFCEKITLPTQEKINAEIEKEMEIRNRRPRPQFTRGSIFLSDELAKEIGAYPDNTKLDHELFNKAWTGPFTTASFRLMGSASEKESSMKIIDILDKIIKKEKPFLGHV